MDAARTAQTSELVTQELESEIDYREALYLAEPSKILAVVRGAPAAVELAEQCPPIPLLSQSSDRLP